MSEIPEVECVQCDGWGVAKVDRADCADGWKCPACNGEGYRPMSDSELEAAYDRQQEDLMSEPPMSLAEQQRRAWEQKHGAVR